MAAGGGRRPLHRGARGPRGRLYPLLHGAQAVETAAKHFAGQADLVLVAVDAARLGEALRWEPSRGGALFPHLYADLMMDAVLWVKPLPLGADGRHAFPDMPA